LEENDWKALSAKLQSSPLAARIPGVLRDAHAMLLGEEKKRLSESE
jgi:hypothetical protein